ncbi:MAG: M42 family metallopeptidase [Candidatus Flexifilum sp.]
MMLRELSEAAGISGQEDAVRKIVLNAIKGHVDSIRIDPLGSVTAIKRGTGERPLRVLVAAHMDEVGFMVTGFESDGTIRFTPVGGIDERILPGLRVRIGAAAVPGVILWTPIHKNQDQSVVKLANLRIDIGASSKDEAADRVKRGDPIVFDAAFRELEGGVLRGKAFDDRSGCALLIDVLQAGPYPVEVIGAFTVQEEIGLRGAQVVAQTVNPDVAFILEGTTAHDLPDPLAQPDDAREINPTSRMRGGPVISVMDRSLIVPPRLVQFLRETAEAEGIPYQYKTQLGGGTDGGAVHTANAGVKTAVISLPCRYIHSPLALLHRDDYAAALKLIQAALHRISADILT